MPPYLLYCSFEMLLEADEDIGNILGMFESFLELLAVECICSGAFKVHVHPSEIAEVLQSVLQHHDGF